MRRPGPILLAAAFFGAADTAHAQEISVNKVTPLMTVEAIEPCLPFWTDRLGFQVTVSVPHGEHIGFAILQKGDAELMYQSRGSVAEDLGTMAPDHPTLADDMAAGMSTLFIEVDALDPVVSALDGAEIVVPRRQTFYGMDEIFVRAPCGTLVGFAAKVETGAEEG
jgi:catechol 2,3-dioxygenase-like lactoylglutathione lyase family enzyme